MTQNIDYEKTLQEENLKLKAILADAQKILDDKYKELNENIKKYGDNNFMDNWEITSKS